MPPDLNDGTADFSLALKAERFYMALAHAARSDAEPNLGGKLLYAGELDADGRALIVAANIAGAASLAASAEPGAQKQVVRDGVADFLVTSLDEALRILKNEIRKHEAVAVCVACAPATVEREMRERGVMPDLLRPGAAAARKYASFLGQGAQQIQLSDLDDDQTLLAWSVASAPAQWMPKLDAIALDCLAPEDAIARRWLRVAPRYLGRLSQNQRLLRCSKESAQRFLRQLCDQVERGEIRVPVEVNMTDRGESASRSFTPPSPSNIDS